MLVFVVVQAKLMPVVIAILMEMMATTQHVLDVLMVMQIIMMLEI